MDYLFVGDAIMKQKTSERDSKLLADAIQVLKKGGMSGESITVMEKERQALDTAVLCYNCAIATPLDPEFVEKWQAGEYEKDLQESVRKHYAAFIEDKESQRPKPFTIGMAVVKFGLYSYEGKIWQWTDGDLAACPWPPGSAGLWQWQLWEG